MSEALGFARKRLIEKIALTNWDIKAPGDKQYNFNELLFIVQEMMNEEGKKYFEHRSSRRGHHIFREFVKYLLYRNLANYDSMILLTSEKGTGKSSAGIMIAREWCRLTGIRFNPARHIAYNNADVMRKIDTLNKFEPILCDEAIRFACIAGESLIKTSSGTIPIKDLEGQKYFEVYSYNEKTQKEEIQIAEKCIKVKEDVVYEIETEDGQKIQATKEHKFLTTTGWKKLEELKDGDSIITT